MPGGSGLARPAPGAGAPRVVHRPVRQIFRVSIRAPRRRATCDRRRILDQELSSEQRSLEAARRELEEQESTRNGADRSSARAAERVQPYRDKVQLHERNVEALRREISNLR